jgi:predicted TIM-barrel fold metal-dependent hydrolase
MPYAQGRTYYDADSHVMEPKDWLTPYADPSIREELRPGHGLDFDLLEVERLRAQRRTDAAKAERARTRLAAEHFLAYGAWDPAERSRALDELGYDAQLVFPTFALNQFLGKAPDVVYGGARAHNRAIVEFCSADPRLIAVAFVPLDDPERAATEATFAVDLGAEAVLIPFGPPKQHSPAHPAYDAFWSCLSDADVPGLLHIGGGGRLVPGAYRDNGKPVPPDLFGGGENIRALDYLGIHVAADYFLSAMALQGLFERFPGVRIGATELGAEWVVTMLRRVDQAQRSFRKTEPDVAGLPLRPSEYLHRQVKATPFPGEDVGWLIEQGAGDMVLFSSDYPHVEGGRDPIAKFEATMSGVSEEDRERFYAGNFAELMGSRWRSRQPAPA